MAISTMNPQSIQSMVPGSLGTFRTSTYANGVLFVASGTSGTAKITLPNTDALAYIMLKLRHTNGATSNTAQTIENSITNIQLKGNNTDFGCNFATAWEARQAAQRMLGYLPPVDESQLAAAVQYLDIPIYFGSVQKDPTSVFPSAAYSQVVLQFDYAFTENASTGFATSTSAAKYDIILCEYLAPLLNPKQQSFMRWTEFNYISSTASSGDVRIKVPRGNPYRTIAVQAYKAAVEDGAIISNIKLSLNNDRNVLQNTDWLHCQEDNRMNLNLVSQKRLSLFTQNAATYASKISRIQALGQPTSQVAGHTAQITSVTGDTITLAVLDTATPSNIAANEGVGVELNGQGASFLAILDFDPDMDGTKLLQTAGLQTDPELVLTQAVSAAAVRCFAQEIVKPTVA